MKESIYKAARLNIFEKHRENLITEAQRDELFAVLEKEKADTDLTDDKVLDILDEMEDKYPDLKDDIKKLAKKIKKDTDGGDGDAAPAEDGKGDDTGDGKGEEEPPAEEVSEAFNELMNEIKNL